MGPQRASRPLRAVVATDEAGLLRLAGALVNPSERLTAASLLRATTPPPERVGATAMRLLQDRLRVGSVRALMRMGGWRRAEASVDGGVAEGRLWTRRAPIQLDFGEPSFTLLRWLATHDLRQPEEKLKTPPKSTGDRLLYFLACGLLAEHGMALGQPGFRQAPLCRLAFPDRLGTSAVGSMAPCLELIEALQGELAERWFAMERDKGKISDHARMQRLGQQQTLALDAFMKAIAGRRELAGFLVEAAERALRGGPDRRWWVQSLARSTLSERQKTHRAAGAMLRAVSAIGDWYRSAGVVQFFDDDYDEAQMLLRAFAPLGADGFARAQALAAELEEA